MAMKTRALLSLIAITLAAAGSPASAQVYPSRPITMVVPLAAGGPLDTLARILAEPMRASLGQPVIVENVTGAAGTVGTGRVARAAPDGYTFGMGFLGTHVLSGAIYALPYDVVKDFDPIALISSNPHLIVAKASLPAKNLHEFIAWLKLNPDKASTGTAGAGTSKIGRAHV
jgi:tripartite-type tricarboxylate transporter receptor subunit TctC